MSKILKRTYDTIDNALDTQKVSLMRTFDGEEDNNRVYYIKSTPVEVSAETLTVELNSNSIMVCAVADSNSDYYDSSYSFINEDGGPMESAERGHPQYLPTPVVTISEDGATASWEAIEGAVGYKYLLGSPVPYSNAKKGFADSYNRVYVDRSNGKGIYRRTALSPNPFGPRDPDPEDFAQNKMMDSIPLRMDDGFLRVPVSSYGESQPAVGDDNYDENQRAMSKKYVDTATKYAITQADNKASQAVSDAAQYADGKYSDATKYADNKLKDAKKYADNYNPITTQYPVASQPIKSKVLNINANSATTRAISRIKLMNGAGEYSLLSLDLKYNSSSSLRMSEIIFRSSQTYLFGLAFQLSNDVLTLLQYNTGSGGTGSDPICELPYNEWFNLKLYYHRAGDQSALTVLVNDIEVASNINCYYSTASTTSTKDLSYIDWRVNKKATIVNMDNILLVNSDTLTMPFANKITFEDEAFVNNYFEVYDENVAVTEENNIFNVIADSVCYIPLANENGELHGNVSETSGETVLVNKGYVNSKIGDIQSVLEAINAQINTFEGA